MTDTQLELYQTEDCPFCRKVRRFCGRNGISLTIHNPRTAGTPLSDGVVTDGDRYAELQGDGKDQIPYLIDRAHDRRLYESDAIIEHLRTHHLDDQAPDMIDRLDPRWAGAAKGVLLTIAVLAISNTLTGYGTVNTFIAGMGVFMATYLVLERILEYRAR